MNFPMIRSVPYMGVIWVVHEASKLGFYNGHPDWCNLGQGQPRWANLRARRARILASHPAGRPRLWTGRRHTGGPRGRGRIIQPQLSAWNEIEVHRRQRIHRLPGAVWP